MILFYHNKKVYACEKKIRREYIRVLASLSQWRDCNYFYLSFLTFWKMSSYVNILKHFIFTSNIAIPGTKPIYFSDQARWSNNSLFSCFSVIFSGSFYSLRRKHENEKIRANISNVSFSSVFLFVFFPLNWEEKLYTWFRNFLFTAMMTLDYVFGGKGRRRNRSVIKSSGDSLHQKTILYKHHLLKC